MGPHPPIAARSVIPAEPLFRLVQLRIFARSGDRLGTPKVGSEDLDQRADAHRELAASTTDLWLDMALRVDVAIKHNSGAAAAHRYIQHSDLTVLQPRPGQVAGSALRSDDVVDAQRRGSADLPPLVLHEQTNQSPARQFVSLIAEPRV